MIKGGRAVANTPKQKKAEKTIVADTTADEKRTTLSLSFTMSDKETLKIMSAEHDTTIAAIIHQ